MITVTVFIVYFSFNNPHMYSMDSLANMKTKDIIYYYNNHHKKSYKYKNNIEDSCSIDNNKKFHINSNYYRIPRDIKIEDREKNGFINVKYKTWHEYCWLIFLIWFINWCTYFENKIENLKEN